MIFKYLFFLLTVTNVVVSSTSLRIKQSDFYKDIPIIKVNNKSIFDEYIDFVKTKKDK